jgi:hypothetical protein
MTGRQASELNKTVVKRRKKLEPVGFFIQIILSRRWQDERWHWSKRCRFEKEPGAFQISSRYHHHPATDVLSSGKRKKLPKPRKQRKFSGF